MQPRLKRRICLKSRTHRRKSGICRPRRCTPPNNPKKLLRPTNPRKLTRAWTRLRRARSAITTSAKPAAASPERPIPWGAQVSLHRDFGWHGRKQRPEHLKPSLQLLQWRRGNGNAHRVGCVARGDREGACRRDGDTAQSGGRDEGVGAPVLRQFEPEVECILVRGPARVVQNIGGERLSYTCVVPLEVGDA